MILWGLNIFVIHIWRWDDDDDNDDDDGGGGSDDDNNDNDDGGDGDSDDDDDDDNDDDDDGDTCTLWGAIRLSILRWIQANLPGVHSGIILENWHHIHIV